MIRRLFNSIASRVAAVTLIGLAGLQVLGLALMQFPALHGLLPGVLDREGDAIVELVWMLEAAPEELEPYLLSINTGGARYTEILGDFPQGFREIPRLKDAITGSDNDVASRLDDRTILFGSRTFLFTRRLIAPNPENGVDSATAFLIGVELDDGRVLIVHLAPFVYLSSGNVFLGVVLLCLLLFLFQNVAFATVILKPIRRLEADAERVSLSEHGFAVSETGPFEMQRVAKALNRMRSRLAGLVQEREQIITAIAHDIRTGITKIRLRMDASGSVEVADLETDLSQMETLITDMVTYARAESPARSAELINLERFASEQAEGAPFPVEFHSDLRGKEFIVVGDPLALKRLFDNLLENARRYGSTPIAMLVECANDLVIRIRDHGEGIPKPLMETAFEPFVRGEASRSRETGGSGLGLGIARAIARSHGAELHLENHDGGGLDAILTFPSALKA